MLYVNYNNNSTCKLFLSSQNLHWGGFDAILIRREKFYRRILNGLQGPRRQEVGNWMQDLIQVRNPLGAVTNLMNTWRFSLEYLILKLSGMKNRRPSYPYIHSLPSNHASKLVSFKRFKPLFYNVLGQFIPIPKILILHLKILFRLLFRGIRNSNV